MVSTLAPNVDLQNTVCISLSAYSFEPTISKLAIGCLSSIKVFGSSSLFTTAKLLSSKAPSVGSNLGFLTV